MIPSNFKDILAHIENAGILQTLAMLIFIIFFLSTVYYVMSRPKKHYSDVEKAPLEDE
ncbi:MAG: CcoQ/FixQ family Cbb3-type cytochrome c oxidase assembly chaperone [Cloacibacterium sp.]|jgi:cbb3-type cytochrome oxidase subunit 3|nr:CcoQ/FixQ family Cbb3-type cytochrome c oxidase assembly chaperone [Cloacibacterium sp.]MBP8060710.1 CcoQ/FixQ family Cbb3-type cytochrome c oxidase assembly chaperone [Cloacibacterium sp.]MBP8084793.1 CcoQ/FixQ family Cbb3-type cytochrome c oxidase assembly chaperone [Cloacibacterium sp.]